MASRTQVVSYSEIDTYRQCPLKHQLAYVERWQRPAKEGSALDKGTLWHAVLEQHYLVLREAQLAAKLRTTNYADADYDWVRDEAHRRITALLYNEQTGEIKSETAELILWMYEGHLERWGFDPHWEILAVESKEIHPLWWTNPRTGVFEPSRFRLKTKIDLVVRDHEFGGRIWVVDHKSGKDLPRSKALDIDDQFGLYTLQLRRMGKKVFGQVYSANRTQRNKTGIQTPESRLERYRLYRDDRELLAIERDAVETIRKAYAARHGDAPASPNPDLCMWKCDFLEPHIQARKQGRTPSEVVADYDFEQEWTRH